MKRAFSKGSYVHVIKRGVRGMPIVKDKHDKWRFLRSLYYLNDQPSRERWSREVESTTASGFSMPRPQGWEAQQPWVKVHAYTLMPNHFHLLLEEIVDGGIAAFMRKVGGSMTKYFNEKYDQSGSLFQSSYKSSVVDSDAYLRFLLAYILIKNPFELHPKGFKYAIDNFDKAFDWAQRYPFSSLGSFTDKYEAPPIIETNLDSLFDDTKDFKAVGQEAVSFSATKKLESILLE